jgi:hypothetical protein
MKSTLKEAEKILIEIEKHYEAMKGDLGEDYWKKSDRLRDQFFKYVDKSEPGLYPGRVVAWPHADGRAYYIVKSIGKNLVTLWHVPIDDAWHSPVVSGNKAMREAVEQAIRFTDGMKKLFSKQKKEKQPV